ncbi:hypothetical protein R3P38DRAFT_2792200 [Favolaschia claudopus]|uniref:Uncharacterized protein n=1 Tax=Favolaschia claudopus TaxID=2862362 RepID=A0AAW0AI14_9AGAR
MVASMAPLAHLFGLLYLPWQPWHGAMAAVGTCHAHTVSVGMGGTLDHTKLLHSFIYFLPSSLRVRLDIKCTRRENVCQSMDMTVRFGIVWLVSVMPVPLCNLQFNGYGSPLVLHRLYTFEPLRPLERKFLAILFTRLENVCLSVELLILAFSSTQDLYKNRFISVITDASRNGGGGRVWVGWTPAALVRGSCLGYVLATGRAQREREIGTRRRHEGRIELAAPNRCCAGLSTGEGMAVAASLGVVRRTVGSVGNAEKSGGWRVEGCGVMYIYGGKAAAGVPTSWWGTFERWARSLALVLRGGGWRVLERRYCTQGPFPLIVVVAEVVGGEEERAGWRVVEGEMSFEWESEVKRGTFRTTLEDVESGPLSP